MNSLVHRLIAYLLSIFHPYTIGRTGMAIIRGAGIAIAGVQAWVSADDRSHLREANAVKHDRITRTRAWAAGILALCDVVVLLFCLRFLGLRFGLSVWVNTHVTVLLLIGRNGPIMYNVSTPYTVGETRLKQHVDDITATAESRKREQHTTIVQPVARLASGKGWEAVVRVSEHANPIALRDGRETLTHRMQKPAGTVFVQQSPADVSTFRILGLDENPWDGPPTVNPLVAEPRPVNLWRERVEMGQLPDSTPYTRWMVRAGVGGSALFGGAPGTGKTVLNLNFLVPIVLHTGSNLSLIDGKGVDFVYFAPVCSAYIADPKMTDVELLTRTTALLAKMDIEMERRRVLFADLKIVGVSEAVCREHGIQLEWVVIDELAVLTEDTIAAHKDEVTEFLRLVSRLARLGRAFGIYVLLSTQRPTEKVIPPALKGIITGFRAALYVADEPASRAIMGKAGLENRADKLDPEQRGVGVVLGTGQVRFHNIEMEDLPAVIDYAMALRGQTTVIRPASDYPEPVASILRVFHVEHDPKELPTWAIIKGLISLGFDHDPVTLAEDLRQWGVRPTNVGPKREKGYRRAQLSAVPSPLNPSAQGGLTARSQGVDERHMRPPGAAPLSGTGSGYTESPDWTTDNDEDDDE